MEKGAAQGEASPRLSSSGDLQPAGWRDHGKAKGSDMTFWREQQLITSVVLVGATLMTVDTADASCSFSSSSSADFFII